MKQFTVLISLFVSILFVTESYSQTDGCQSMKLKSGNNYEAQIDSIKGALVYYKTCPVNDKSTTKRVAKVNVLNLSELTPLFTPTETKFDCVIITKDGNEFTGKLVEETNTFIRLKTNSLGELKILKSEISEIEKIDKQKVVSGKVWRENHQAARYFWSPNGFGLKKGEGYYQNNWILFNQVSYGFTDNFSMGVGTVPIFLFGARVLPFWITPKVSIPIKKDQFNIGGGLLLGGIIGDDNDSGYAGIAYGVTTFGDRDANLNLGMGYGFVQDDWADIPVFTISGMYRYSRSSFVLTENWIVDGGAVVSFGGRTIWRKVSLDYGLLLPVPTAGFAIPWLGFSIAF